MFATSNRFRIAVASTLGLIALPALLWGQPQRDLPGKDFPPTGVATGNVARSNVMPFSDKKRFIVTLAGATLKATTRLKDNQAIYKPMPDPTTWEYWKVKRVVPHVIGGVPQITIILDTKKKPNVIKNRVPFDGTGELDIVLLDPEEMVPIDVIEVEETDPCQ